MKKSSLSLIGFGSQGSAWAENARDSGWTVEVFLHREGPSWKRALEMGFSPQLLSQSLPESELVALLLPDSAILPCVRERFQRVDRKFHFVLAHGFAAVEGLLNELGPNQTVSLLAPKAIGPELRAAFREGKGSHGLAAAIHSSGTEEAREIRKLAGALGFREDRLIPASFDQEARADWMSEQGVLCGGLFTLLAWTLEEMDRQGVPRALQREECLTELRLIANVLVAKGLTGTFDLISDAAKAGTLEMNEFLETGGRKEAFQAKLKEGASDSFPIRVTSGAWRENAKRFRERLSKLDPGAPK